MKLASILKRGHLLTRQRDVAALLIRSLSSCTRQVSHTPKSRQLPGGVWQTKEGSNHSLLSLIAMGGLAATTATFALADYKPISDSGLRISQEVKKEIKTPNDLEVTLYQYQPCPFCNKVRAFLDLNKIPYKVIEVDPLRKTEIKWSEYKKVPVVVVNGRQLNDSTEIIAAISTMMSDKPLEDQFTLDDKKWLEWLDSYYVKLLPPNIYRTRHEAVQTFDYLTTEGNFSWWVQQTSRYLGAAAMYLVGKKLQKKYDIGDPREDLYAATNSWVDAVKEKGGDFLGGSKPSIADVAVFGVMKSLTNFDTFGDLMANTEVKPWYDRMQKAVGESSRIVE